MNDRDKWIDSVLEAKRTIPAAPDVRVDRVQRSAVNRITDHLVEEEQP